MNLLIAFSLPFEVPSQNKTMRAHWGVISRQNKNWYMALKCMLSMHIDMDIVPAKTKRKVEIIAYRKRLITDHANLVGGAKGLVDALVRAELLVDDSDRWCEITYRQKQDSVPQTLIEIWENTP